MTGLLATNYIYTCRWKFDYRLLYLLGLLLEDHLVQQQKLLCILYIACGCLQCDSALGGEYACTTGCDQLHVVGNKLCLLRISIIIFSVYTPHIYLKAVWFSREFHCVYIACGYLLIVYSQQMYEKNFYFSFPPSFHNRGLFLSVFILPCFCTFTGPSILEMMFCTNFSSLLLFSNLPAYQ